MASLYFIAVLPHETLADKITLLKHHCKEHFGSGHALNSPPHITLHMPFKWNEKKRPALDTCLSQVAAESQKFQVQLLGFDFFEPRVVFVDVVENQDLKELQKRLSIQMRLDLNLFNADYKDRPFHPHVTIAFRDLKKPRFYEAKTYFSQQQFAEAFEVRDIVLLKHHGKNWEVEMRFPFDN